MLTDEDKYSDYEYESTNDEDYYESLDDNDSLIEDIKKININNDNKDKFYEELMKLISVKKDKLCYEYENNSNFDVKIKMFYKNKNYYLYMKKWKDFLELYKKINKNYKIKYYEIITDRIKFFMDIEEKTEEIINVKKILEKYFKDKYDLNVEIISYKSNEYIRFIVNNYCFYIEDFKDLYNDIKDKIKNNKFLLINDKYIQLDCFTNEIFFLTNIYNTEFCDIQKVKSSCLSIIKNTNTPCNDIGFLYIIQEREFINTGEDVFKIGCTQDLIKRFKQYPKGSIIKFSIMYSNYKMLEKKWINLLIKDRNITKRKDIGNEYFQCNYILLINKLIKVINT